MPLPPYNETVWEHGRTSRLLDRFFSGYPFPARRDIRIYYPKVHVEETEKQWIITCEIPDLIKEDDLEVELRDHVLHIDAKNLIQRKDPALPYMVKRYKTSFPLPSSASCEGIQSFYEKDEGVLYIIIPKIVGKKKLKVDFR